MSDGADIPVDISTTTAVDVPEVSPQPVNDPPPAETPAAPEPVIEPPQPEEAPVVESPKEVPPPTQVSHAPTILTIKDRAYAAFEKIRFNKRRKLDKIVALAKEKGRIKNDDVEKLLRVSDSTAARYLKQLVLEARLFVTKKENDAWYEPR